MHHLDRALHFPFIVLFTLLVSLAEFVTAEPKLVPTVSMSNNQQNLAPMMHYRRYSKFSPQLNTAAEIKATLEDSTLEWLPEQEEIPNFGYNSDTFLFHTILSNDTDTALTRYLEIGYPLLTELDTYLLFSDDRIEHQTMGANKLFKERPVAHRNFIVPITLPANSQTHFLMKVKSYSSIQIPITLWNPAKLLESEQLAMAALGIYFGIMMFLLFYNLLLYFSIGDKNYLFYVCHVFLLALVQANIRGLTFQLFWPENPGLMYYLLPINIGLAGLAAAIFCSRFLELQQQNPSMYKLFKALQIFLLLGAFSVFVGGYELAIKLGFIGNFTLVVLAQIVSIYAWYRGYRPAKFFAIAYLMLFVGTGLIVLNKLGWIPRNFITENGQALGSLAEVVLLSFALADRITLMRKEKDRAQLELTTQLEQKVSERTTELSTAVTELERVNSLLTQQSREDGLTRVLNRRSFDEVIEREWKRAYRARSPIALIMCDIDHFKHFNDAYGHMVGDDCLRLVSSCVKAVLMRPSDTLFRYGGEEFAILLADTDLEGACLVAERVRKIIAGQSMVVSSLRITVTASFGCAAIIPDQHTNYGNLIKRADEALYQAKAKGRNRVDFS